MKKYMIIILVWQIILHSSFAANNQDLCCWSKITAETLGAIKFIQMYNEIINSFFQSDKSKLEEFSNIDNSIYETVPSYLRHYFACLSNFYLGTLSEENKKLLKNYLEKAKDLCEKSIKENPTFAESRRLLSIIYGWMIDIKWYLAPFYGQNVDAQTRQAYILNRNSPMVMEAIGISLLYTPVIFGGDKKKAGEWFLKAYNSCGSCPEIQYWVATYYLEVNKRDKLCDFYSKHIDTFKLPAFDSINEKIRSVCLEAE